MSAVQPLPEPPVAPAADGFEIRDYMDGVVSLYAGIANVIMQLSWPGVGYGVVDSKVENGQAMRHPVKRTRTTFTYLSVSLMGSDKERAAYRKAVNGQHVQVRSAPGDAVQYNAFDPELQLWVAACLYYGFADAVTQLRGPLSEAEADWLYQEGARFGTTLQVPQEMWPADRAAFDAYWRDGLRKVSIDDHVRSYLLALLDLKNLHWPLRPLLRRHLQLMNIGFLPPEFRDELGVEWTAKDQRRFDRFLRLTNAVYRLMPRFARVFPFNLYLWDLRIRMKLNRKLV